MPLFNKKVIGFSLSQGLRGYERFLVGFFEGGIVGFLEKSAYLCVIAKINLFFG